MKLEEVTKNLLSIKALADALQYSEEKIDAYDVKDKLELFIQNSFNECETKEKFIKDLNDISFSSCCYTGRETYQDNLKYFTRGKKHLLSLISNISETMKQYPDTLKFNYHDNDIEDCRNVKKCNVSSLIKDWIIPVLGILIGSTGGYELYVANGIKNELKQEVKTELKTELKLEMQQEVSQMVKQEVQQKVDNHIIINNNK